MGGNKINIDKIAFNFYLRAMNRMAERILPVYEMGTFIAYIKRIKYVVSVCEMGLGNRLKCLISSMRFADKYSKTLILYWPTNYDYNCKFSDLFENEMIEISSDELQKIRDEKNTKGVYKVLKTWRLEPLLEDRLPYNFAKAYPSETGKNIDFEYDRIPVSLRNKYLACVNKLIPQKYINEKVENFSKIFDKNTISLGVRTWRMSTDDSEARKQIFNIDKVYSNINKLKDSVFFVACDSPGVLQKLINKYGKRILFYPKITFPGDTRSKEGIQDAFVDLLLLSKNKRLIASNSSTFHEMAWWLGGCIAKVDII